MNKKSLDNDPVKRTFDECVKEGLNPNPNPAGSIPPMSQKEIQSWAKAMFNRFRYARRSKKI